jgi:DNA-binding MarR family transcriptional regulator
MGYLRRDIPSENRRTTSVKLTLSGKKLCDTINNNNNEYMKHTLSVLNKDEFEILTKALEKITTNMAHLRFDPPSDLSCCCKK